MPHLVARALPLLVLGAAALAAAAEDAPPAKPATRNVAIVVHEGVELLDFAGPGEVFDAAGRPPSAGAPRRFRVFTVAPAAGPVVSQGFVTVTPQYSIDDCPKPDILVIPGGATGVLLRDEKFMSWVKSVAPGTEVAFSVCTGAFVLAKAGLLDGLEATTHWGSIGGLRKDAPKTKIVENRRFVDNGRVVTTAGVSAGIDGALHVVARLFGRATADRTARYMEYLWKPEPELEKLYSAFDPSLDERGRRLEEADAHLRAKRFDEAARIYGELSEKNPEDGESLLLLGLALHSKGDLDRAIPAHEKAAAFAPQRPRALYNLACAYALQGENEKSLDALGRAVDAGFGSREWLLEDEDFARLKDDPRFRAIVARIPER